MNVVFAIQDEIRLGARSFKSIADMFNVNIKVVNMIWEEMCVAEFAE